VDQYVDTPQPEHGEGPGSDDLETSKQKRWGRTGNSDAKWNLAQISERGKPRYENEGPYWYAYMDDPKAGTGVEIYILDTGVDLAHPAFEGRASNFRGLSSSDRSPYLAAGDMVCC
jgi:subtilisin family serine protease